MSEVLVIVFVFGIALAFLVGFFIGSGALGAPK